MPYHLATPQRYYENPYTITKPLQATKTLRESPKKYILQPNMKFRKKHPTKSFTLVELIVVIAIIAIISSVVFVALDPAKRFADARNAKRHTAVQSILDAIKMHQVDNDGVLASGIDTTLRIIGTDVSECDLVCGVIGASTEVSVRVSSDDDDAEEQDPPNGDMYMDSTDLELVNEGSTDQEVGMRFQNIEIPQGANILSSYIEFTVDEGDTETTNLTFYGEDIDNAPTFVNVDGNITSRTKTSESVDWDNVPDWEHADDTHQTPDLSSIIQEIIDRDGWVSGNSIVIIVDGTGERTAESYDGTPSEAPLLVIEYTTGSEELTASSCLDLNATLQGYLNTIPIDPKIGSEEKTYYAIKEQVPAGIKVVACRPENDQSIELSR